MEDVKMTDLEMIVNYPELHFEVSENLDHLDEIIAAVEKKYPGYRFDRTEARYISCVMAIFEKH